MKPFGLSLWEENAHPHVNILQEFKESRDSSDLELTNSDLAQPLYFLDEETVTCP